MHGYPIVLILRRWKEEGKFISHQGYYLTLFQKQESDLLSERELCIISWRGGGVPRSSVSVNDVLLPSGAPAIIKELHKLETIKHSIMESGERLARPCPSLRSCTYLMVSENGEREEGRDGQSEAGREDYPHCCDPCSCKQQLTHVPVSVVIQLLVGQSYI